MRSWFMRLTYGLLFALPFGLVSVVWAQAYSPDMPQEQAQMACQDCHPAIQAAWEESHHSQGLTCQECHLKVQSGQIPLDERNHNLVLTNGHGECMSCHTTYDPSTDTGGGPGITCDACHNPVPEDHPDKPMPMDNSPEVCGRCHIETMFEWQASKHRLRDLTCVSCHGPHSTTLRAEDASALCASCHRERAANFAHTAHSQQGMSCADCHLGTLEEVAIEGHAKRDHSFNVRLETCNACHSYQMHDPVEVHTDIARPTPLELGSPPITSGVSVEPEPVNPFSFALLSGLIGMAAGMILAPWLERWYRRLGRSGKQEDQP